MNTKSIFKAAACSFLILATSQFAQLAHANTATDALLEKLKKTYPNIPFSQVNETPAVGVYEAIFDKDLLYVEASGTYFFPTMVNMATKSNLGEDRRDELNKITFSDLPIKDAVKVVHGNGKKVMAVFVDLNCGYCKKLEVNLGKVKDVTIYTFALGILGADSVAKANSLNSSSGDKGLLLRSIMVDGARPSVVPTPAGTAMTDRNLALFKKYGFQGTPAIVFSNGISIKGYAETDRIEDMLGKS
jgi:thiol:disulfide interchange protein DsbC